MNDENKLQAVVFTSLLVEIVVRNVGDKWAVILTRYKERLHLFRSNKTQTQNFYCCTVHYEICMLFINQQLHFLLNLETFN
jgi:hypothetical protein